MTQDNGPETAVTMDGLVRDLLGLDPSAIATIGGALRDPGRATAEGATSQSGLNAFVRRVLALCVALEDDEAAAVRLKTEQSARANGWPHARTANAAMLLAWALLLPDREIKGLPEVRLIAAGGPGSEEPLDPSPARLAGARELVDRMTRNLEVTNEMDERRRRPPVPARADAGTPVPSGNELIRSLLGLEPSILASAFDSFRDEPGAYYGKDPERAGRAGLDRLIRDALRQYRTMTRRKVNHVRLMAERDAQEGHRPDARSANSLHTWFEDRGLRCTLIVFIDDVTGRLTALRFAPVESTRAYLEALRDHVWAHGRPLAFYSDRHGIFRVNAKEAASGDGKTEFGRVVKRLDIAAIHALTPQAKGRVERANQTLQDRLVKELRLMGVSSIEAANAVLPAFMLSWNSRFAVAPRDKADAHRPFADTREELEDALARRDTRTLSKALTFRAGGTVYCVRTKGSGVALRGVEVELRYRLGGTMTVHYKDRILPVTACRTYPVPDPAEDDKTIDFRIDAIVAASHAQAATSLEAGRG